MLHHYNLNNSDLQLADFGLAKESGSITEAPTQTTGVGTIGWMAPEILNQEKDTDALRADVFALVRLVEIYDADC